jgi:hypothetical protein
VVTEIDIDLIKDHPLVLVFEEYCFFVDLYETLTVLYQ